MSKFIISCFILISSISLHAQEVNHIITDKDLDMKILIGRANENGLANPVFIENWQDALDSYTPDKLVAKKLRKIFRKSKTISIKVFFGSWCGDSQEQIPNFVKLMHKTRFKNVEYYGVSRQKTMPCMDISVYNIERVPTFVIYKDDVEIGRIIETPTISLEKDLVKILEP